MCFKFKLSTFYFTEIKIWFGNPVSYVPVYVLFCIIYPWKKIPIYLGHSNHIQDHEQQAYSNHYNNNEIKNNFVQDCENFKFPILQDFYDQQIIADETISDVTSTKRRK